MYSKGLDLGLVSYVKCQLSSSKSSSKTLKKKKKSAKVMDACAIHEETGTLAVLFELFSM